MPSKKKVTKKTVAKRKPAKRPVKKTSAKKVASKKTVAKKTGKRQYSRGERTILIVAYSGFASVFILFANEADNNTWYYLLAFVCLAMVMRHCAGVLRSYGEK